LTRYFPLAAPSKRHEVGTGEERLARPELGGTGVVDGGEGLLPGEGYSVYDSADVLGSTVEEHEVVIGRAVRFCGVDSEYMLGVVETFERRAHRWWRRRGD
jgi:RNA polymerase I-specific transcription initiation factor RRN7